MSEKVITAAYHAGVQDGTSRDYYAGITEGRIKERERIIAAFKENYTNDEDDWAIDWAIEIVEELGGKE